MTKKTKIKVKIADELKREAVVLSSSGEVLAEGETSRQLLARLYGKR